MSRKPRVITACVANNFTDLDERVIEFTGGPDKGGLISFRQHPDGTLVVSLYHLDGKVQVNCVKAENKVGYELCQ